MQMQRRQFLAAMGFAGAEFALGSAVAAEFEARNPDSAAGMEWTMYSRHLQWLTTRDYTASHPYETGILIGEKAQEIGCRHIDLTVRRDGHVDPERVDVARHLPEMLRGIRSTGATCREMTTGIAAADRPLAGFQGQDLPVNELLQLASDAGIRYYKWSGFNYDTTPDAGSGRPQPFGDGVIAQLDAFVPELEAIAALSRRYGMTALYHTYSGRNGLRSVWDLVYVHRRFDPNEVGFNFDIGHMAREGALSAWSSNVRYAMPYIKGVSLKDAMLGRGEDGRVNGSFVAAGEGLVQWQDFFTLLLEGGFQGPVEAQYEYLAQGLLRSPASLNNNYWADDEQFTSGNLTAEFMSAELQKDLRFYKQSASEAGWTDSQ